MLASRRKCALTTTLFAGSPWVFPAESESGHIADPREELDLRFTVHGLRNTFVIVAESLDTSPYTIKMLVNHSTPDKQDVTAGYITPELERLRKPMQVISDWIKSLLRGNHAVC